MISRRRGVTFIEIILAIAITAVLAAIVVAAFSAFQDRTILDGAALNVLSFIEETRVLALTGKMGVVYGIHLDSSAVVRFVGSAYQAGSSGNMVLTLPAALAITAIAIGGGNDVVFARLTGAPSISGTFRVSSVASSTLYKTIVIENSGAVSIQ